MNKPETIKIDEVEYIRADSVKKQRPAGNLKIVVLERGFVYIGFVEIIGDFVHIQKAKNIRVWGTTKGLGELVNGPTKSTKLDDVGLVVAPMRAVISLIDADESAWKL